MDQSRSQQGLTIIRTVLVLLSAILLVLVFVMALSAARSSFRDYKRLKDMQQVAAALKVYHEYYQKYPEAVSGQPKGLIPTYLGFWPEAPTPPDGTCDTATNNYSYEQLDKGSSYSLNFCLGHKTEGFNAGYYNLKPTIQ
ncbi:MAG: hypothetical protein ACM3KM_03490 [Acidobacteriaceae bacterium]